MRINYFVVVFLSIIAASGLFSVIGTILKALGLISISWWFMIVPGAVFCAFVGWLVYLFIDGLKYVG